MSPLQGAALDGITALRGAPTGCARGRKEMFSEDMTSSAAMRLDACYCHAGCVDEHQDGAEPIFLLAVDKGGGRRTALRFPLLRLVSRLSGRAGSGRPTSAGRQARPRG